MTVSELSCPGQTRTKVACMRVDKREFVYSFLNSHVMVKREQDLHESLEVRV